MSNPIKKGIRFLKDQDYRFLVCASWLKHYPKMDAELYLRKRFHAKMGYHLNLETPTTFSEKIQWLKLYDHHPEYSRMVDKHDAKEWAETIIGQDYIVPSFCVWDRPEDIDFDALPNRFVLKCTHDSHGIVICKDKADLDIGKARKKLAEALSRDYYLIHREWPYKNVKPRIIAEQYLSDPEQPDSLPDYKIWCFNGKPKMILVCRDRFASSGLTEDFFDTEWNHLDIRRKSHGNCKTEIPKPGNLEQMLLLAEKISQKIPFLRVDFYSICGKLYFGECTFYPASGFEPFIPEEWDRKLGDMLNLPEKQT